MEPSKGNARHSPAQDNYRRLSRAEQDELIEYARINGFGAGQPMHFRLSTQMSFSVRRAVQRLFPGSKDSKLERDFQWELKEKLLDLTKR